MNIIFGKFFELSEFIKLSTSVLKSSVKPTLKYPSFTIISVYFFVSELKSLCTVSINEGKASFKFLNKSHLLKSCTAVPVSSPADPSNKSLCNFFTWSSAGAESQIDKLGLSFFSIASIVLNNTVVFPAPPTPNKNTKFGKLKCTDSFAKVFKKVSNNS